MYCGRGQGGCGCGLAGAGLCRCVIDCLRLTVRRVVLSKKFVGYEDFCGLETRL